MVAERVPNTFPGRTRVPIRGPRAADLLRVRVLLLACIACFMVIARGAEETGPPIRQGITAACDAPAAGLAQMAERIPGGTGIAEAPLEMRDTVVGREWRIALPGNAELRIKRFAPGGRLRRLVVEYWAADPGGGVRPRIAAVADADCTIRHGRRLVYESESPQAAAIEYLDGELDPTGEREPLNPPVPAGTDPGGVGVALVDSGVNYLLPRIARQLARDDAGAILGYDYWDMDGRPFDANPARSPFFPQRHGTRTASLLLREAPQARLVPYRYPRPEMDRMEDLVDDAAAQGIGIVNISLGSGDRGEWEAFEAAAKAHPDTLFVVSAGNNGRDIDADPIYPAVLSLDNTITVTSADRDGEPARGSNWGGQSVDLLVPAERVRVTDFDGQATVASGSSYAAVRISALAARLLAAHPDWHAARLKEAIFARVLPSFSEESGAVAEGFIPRPDKAEDLPPLPGEGEPSVVARYAFSGDRLHDAADADPSGDFVFAPTFTYFEDTAWTRADLRRHARRMADILGRCGIRVSRVEVHALDGPAVYRYFRTEIAERLARRLELPRPTVYFVRDTLAIHAYDAVAFGKSNSTTRPALRDTVWFTEDTRDPGLALAHELVHVLMDSGEHVETPGNLMRADTAPANTELTERQCREIVERGTANGLLEPASG